MAGLPKKYAKMGFSKGWKAYKATKKGSPANAKRKGSTMTKSKKSGRRSGNKLQRFFGISRSGIKIGKAITGGSLIAIPLVPCQVASDQKSYSPLQILIGSGPIGANTLGTRAAMAVNAAAWNVAGMTPIGVSGAVGTGSNTAAPTGYLTASESVCGYGIATGIGLSLAGSFINPAIAGSPVKL